MIRKTILFFMFLASLIRADARAGITKLEYLLDLPGLGFNHPDWSERFLYKVHFDGMDNFDVHLERWEWVPDSFATEKLVFKDRHLLSKNMKISLEIRGETYEHEFASLWSMDGSSVDEKISYSLDEKTGWGTILIQSDVIKNLFPKNGKRTLELTHPHVGIAKRVHGVFSPGIGDLHEYSDCYDGGEWDPPGCDDLTRVTIFGNQVDFITDLKGNRVYGDLPKTLHNENRIARQGFLTFDIRGHVKGMPVQLRDSWGRILLETIF